MEILYLLIPVSILLVFVIGAIFWWALNHRQFESLDEEANRIFLHDEPVISPPAVAVPAAKNPDQ